MDISEIRALFTKRREEKSLNLEDIAINCSRQTISRFEKGDDIKLSHLCESLGRLDCKILIIKQ